MREAQILSPPCFPTHLVLRFSEAAGDSQPELPYARELPHALFPSHIPAFVPFLPRSASESSPTLPKWRPPAAQIQTHPASPRNLSRLFLPARPFLSPTRCGSWRVEWRSGGFVEDVSPGWFWYVLSRVGGKRASPKYPYVVLCSVRQNGESSR